MFLHVTDATYIDGYKIRIAFSNGESGEVDLSDELYGEMFRPLQNMKQFQNFKVDPEINTVVWANGADFAPDFFMKK